MILRRHHSAPAPRDDIRNRIGDAAGNSFGNTVGHTVGNSIVISLPGRAGREITAILT
jgi:hypothetical protein